MSDPGRSAVSWGAILAGAAGAAALSLLLVGLGVGLGLSALSPWVRGPDGGEIGFTAIAWVCLTQLAAAGFGGYLAGRLRVRQTDLAGGEVFFRDTIHGFLAWGVATMATATLLTSVTAAVLTGGVKVATATGAAAVAVASSSAPGEPKRRDLGAIADPLAYYVDRLFRTVPADAPATDDITGATLILPAPAAARTIPPRDANVALEASRILARALGTGPLPEDDAEYLARLVAYRTGLPRTQAQERVAQVFQQAQNGLDELEARAKSAAEEARRASAAAALWLVLSLLVGAFAAAGFATWGGRRRDR